MAKSGGIGCLGWTVIGILGVCVIGVLGKKDNASSTPESEAPAASAVHEKLPEINAATLLRAYEANEVSADQKYKGARFTVTGPVMHIQKDVLGRAQLLLVSELGGVVANDVREGFAATLKVGDSVRLDCTVQGSIIGSVSLDCS